MKNSFILTLAGVLTLLLLGNQTQAAGLTYSVSDASNWNIRIDGPTNVSGSNSAFSYATLASGDLNGDGLEDLIVGARQSDPNGRNDSGSLYIIYGDLLENSSGTGNIIDINDPSTYTVRIDGAEAEHEGQRRPVVGDFNGDDLLDIAFSSYTASYNSRTFSGSVYVLYNELVGDYTTTGNTLDLDDSSNYHVRFDGSAASELLGAGPVLAEDMNGDGNDDIVIGTNANLVYIVYSELFTDLSGTGNTIDFASSTNYTIRFEGNEHTIPFGGGMLTLGERIGTDSIAVVDVDGDGQYGLFMNAYFASYNGRSLSGSSYILKDDLIGGYTGTGNQVLLASSTNWNYRFDGTIGWDGTGGGAAITASSSRLGYFTTPGVGDIDSDGLDDIAFSEQTNNNGRLYSGSLYVVTGDFLSTYSGTGNTFDVLDTTSWKYRFDGAEEGDRILRGTEIRMVDLDNNGVDDLVFSADEDETETETDRGKVYVIFDHLLDDLAVFTTGNIVDLLDTDNFTIRYDAAASEDWLGGFATVPSDINNDGLTDLLLGAWGSDFNGSDSGSLYVIKYFPHTITLDDISNKNFAKPFTITGTVSAPDNPTTIAAVEWGHARDFGDDSGDFLKTWHDCTPVDGAFDSNDEDFTCAHSALNNGDAHFDSPHTVFFRARDEKGIYTPVSLYPTDTYTVVETSGTSYRKRSTSGDSLVYEKEDEDDTGVDEMGEEGEGDTEESQREELLRMIAVLQEQIRMLTGEEAVSTDCPVFTENLRPGDEGGDVVAIQAFLREQALFTYPENTGYFGLLTYDAVSAFQGLYSEDILIPLDLEGPTGNWFSFTRQKAQTFCDRA